MHPNENLDASSCRAAVAEEKRAVNFDALWKPRISVSARTRFCTYGSCFAQHLGRDLKARGLRWVITESAPLGLSEANCQRFNYGVFSARTGSIPTPSLLRQWVAWADGSESPPDEIWEKQGRFYDPFRPHIEPQGFASPEELLRSRETTLGALRQSILRADVFVFTMGHAESWVHRQGGHEYPFCPATIAPEFLQEQHGWVQQDYPTLRRKLGQAVRQIRNLHAEIQILLTVSPLPLTTTGSGQHIVVATAESKSVLRAVAGAMARDLPFVDYFPAYELVQAANHASPEFARQEAGVSASEMGPVLQAFQVGLSTAGLNRMHVGTRASRPALGRVHRSGQAPASLGAAPPGDPLACEEELLDAFAHRKAPGIS